MRTKQDQIKEIVSEFDFKKCAKVMEFLNWWWHSIKGRTPNEEDIKQHSIKMMHEVYDNRYSALSCGGIVVTMDEGLLCLAFELESYCAEEE